MNYLPLFPVATSGAAGPLRASRGLTQLRPSGSAGWSNAAPVQTHPRKRSLGDAPSPSPSPSPRPKWACAADWSIVDAPGDPFACLSPDSTLLQAIDGSTEDFLSAVSKMPAPLTSRNPSTSTSTSTSIWRADIATTTRSAWPTGRKPIDWTGLKPINSMADLQEAFKRIPHDKWMALRRPMSTDAVQRLLHTQNFRIQTALRIADLERAIDNHCFDTMEPSNTSPRQVSGTNVKLLLLEGGLQRRFQSLEEMQLYLLGPQCRVRATLRALRRATATVQEWSSLPVVSFPRPPPRPAFPLLAAASTNSRPAS